MSSDNAELLDEIKRLREELNQMREIVNVLLNYVMEESEEDEDYETVVIDDSSKRFGLYN